MRCQVINYARTVTHIASHFFAIQYLTSIIPYFFIFPNKCPIVRFLGARGFSFRLTRAGHNRDMTDTGNRARKISGHPITETFLK